MLMRPLMLVLSLASILTILSSVSHAQISATLVADPPVYSGACPAEIKFRGNITSEKAGRIQYRFIRSDGMLQPVETIEFSAPGAKEVSSAWTFTGRKVQAFEGWEAIRIVYPEEAESNRPVFRVICDQTKTDLSVRLKHCPKSARPGYEIIPAVKIIAVNRGEVPVKDVDLDVVLRKESSCSVAAQTTINSPLFPNSILLKGGHEQISLKGDEKQEVKPGGGIAIPADTPLGDYFLCAFIDAGDKIKESNKTNNCACCPIKVTTATGRPDLTIEKFAFRGWGKCEPNMPIFTFEVTVKNIGNAASPAMTDKSIVQVMDLHGTGWGNATGLNSIPPGGTQTVVIPVYYFGEDPAHMTRVVPHPFRAVVDPHHLIDESNESNNKSDIIYLDPGLVCSKGGRN